MLYGGRNKAILELNAELTFFEQWTRKLRYSKIFFYKNERKA